jgi:hypothetical protein
LETFDRYYEQYDHCFATKLDYVIRAELTPELLQP